VNLENQKYYHGSIDLIEQALEGFKRIGDSGEYDIEQIRLRLGKLLLHSNNPRRAEETAEYVLECIDNQRGETSVDRQDAVKLLDMSRANLSNNYSSKSFENSTVKDDFGWSGDDFDVSESKKEIFNALEYGSILYSQKRFMEASQLFSSALEMADSAELSDEDDIKTFVFHSLRWLASSLAGAYDFKAAMPFIERALRLSCRIPESGEMFAHSLSCNLAEWKMMSGDYLGAKEVLDDILPELTSERGEQNEKTLMAMRHLVACLIYLDDLKSAAELMKSVYRVVLKKFGPNHAVTKTEADNLKAVLDAMKMENGASLISISYLNNKISVKGILKNAERKEVPPRVIKTRRIKRRNQNKKLKQSRQARDAAKIAAAEKKAKGQGSKKSKRHH
jgi:tetratricopeptide (TPR) repeat protein